jgi:hypothetical protein
MTANIALADAFRNISIQNNRRPLKVAHSAIPKGDLCRWCARPVQKSEIEALRFYCGPVCISSAAWFVASKKDFGTQAYKSAVGKSARQKVTLPAIAMGAA